MIVQTMMSAGGDKLILLKLLIMARYKLRNCPGLWASIKVVTNNNRINEL